MKKLYWIISICIALIAVTIIFKFFKGNKPTMVITEKAVKRNIIELNNYKYDITIPLYYDDKSKIEQNKN